MGISPFSKSACSCGRSQAVRTVEVPVARPGMPDPKRFVVEETLQVGRFLIAQVQYPDATNFEGRKIMVFRDVDATALWDQAALDPHFCDSPDHLAPIVRFIPTTEGFNMAMTFCRALMKESNAV